MKFLVFVIFIVILVLFIFYNKSFFLKNIIEQTKHVRYEEVNLIIDDTTIDKGNVYEIIKPVLFSVDTEKVENYLNSLKSFSTPQKYVLAIFMYRNEINNGGHSQFYSNSTGLIWEDVVAAFKELSLKDYHDLILESIERFSRKPDKNWIERQRLVTKEEPNFYDLDNRFYELDKAISLESALLEYIKNNREAFYFNKTVLEPVFKNNL